MNRQPPYERDVRLEPFLSTHPCHCNANRNYHCLERDLFSLVANSRAPDFREWWRGFLPFLRMSLSRSGTVSGLDYTTPLRSDLEKTSDFGARSSARQPNRKRRNQDQHECQAPAPSFRQRPATGDAGWHPEQGNDCQDKCRHEQERQQRVVGNVERKYGPLPKRRGQSASQKPAQYGAAQSGQRAQNAQNWGCHCGR